MQSFFYFLGRLCICAVFIFSAANDLFQWNSQEDFVLTSLSKAMTIYGNLNFMTNIYHIIISNLTVFFVISMSLKFIGGVFLLLGWQVRIASVLLLLFLIPVTVIFHDFWNQIGSAKVLQTVMFWKNIGIAGGLFLFLAFGEFKSIKKNAIEKK